MKCHIKLECKQASSLVGIIVQLGSPIYATFCRNYHYKYTRIFSVKQAVFTSLSLTNRNGRRHKKAANESTYAEQPFRLFTPLCGIATLQPVLCYSVPWFELHIYSGTQACLASKPGHVFMLSSSFKILQALHQLLFQVAMHTDTP